MSAVTGIDYLDDARSVVATDWDDDGDLDLLFRNRTGPGLRFLRNDARDDVLRGRAIALELVGTTCNRDAVGARVVLETSGGRRIQEVRAGDGYLAQSSLRLHFFGLAPEERVTSLVVHWPGGAAETIEGVDATGRYRVVQGEGTAVPVQLRPVDLAAGGLPEPGPPPGRVVLRTPFPLPPSLRASLFQNEPSGRAVLVNLWSESCAPCVRELAAFADDAPGLASAGVRIVPLCVDPPERQGAAIEMFQERVAARMSGPGSFSARAATDVEARLIETLLEHTLEQKGAAVLPTSLLIDENGWIQVLYLGPTSPAELRTDVERYAIDPEMNALRGGWPGRWFFGVPRDLSGLSQLLRERGLSAEARFYQTVQRAQGGSRR